MLAEAATEAVKEKRKESNSRWAMNLKVSKWHSDKVIIVSLAAFVYLRAEKLLAAP